MCWLENGMVLVLSWCGVEGMLTFFLKVQHTQRGYHRGLSSLMDKPLVPKMRRLRLEDSPQDSEPLKLIPPLTRGWPRRWPPARQESEPPTWGQIKKLMDMVTMATIRSCAVQRQLLWLWVRLHQEHLRNKKGGDVESTYETPMRTWHEHSYVK
jgi:hypothetical protein